MWIRFLKACARRPLAALAVVLLFAGCAIAAPLLALRGTPEPAGSNPRQLIGRMWFDRYPGKARDEVDLMIFFGSGFGVYEHGSRYKASIEFFEFERQGDKVEMTFFQDKKQHRTRFAIKSCADDDNFDLCLDFDASPRGPKRYYSWGHDDEDSARVPWAKEWKRAAEARARDDE